jgi:hypothetical protein
MGTEETKEQQQIYNLFRSCIYIFLIVELVMNLPVTADNKVTGFILELIARFQVFNSVLSCKFIELICIGVTCIGTRAKKLICKFGFEQLGLNKLYFITNEDNFASIRVNEKCGFKLEGRMRQEYITKDGERKDRLYYGLLKEEWEAANEQ